VVNLFSEDHAAISGLRRLIIRGPLEPERSLNATLSYNRRVGDAENPATFDVDLFATWFSNKIQPDYRSDPTATIYENLDGHAVSRGASVSLDRTFQRVPVAVSGGLTIADVYLVRDGVRRAQEFAPRVSGTFSVSLPIASAGVTLDYTGRVAGPMSLPPCLDLLGASCAGIPVRSPWYSEQNLQLTHTARSGLAVTLAVKNLLDVVVPRPVFDARRPFDRDFQTNFVYGPVEGRRLQVGARYVRARAASPER
jgi:outer membrane receptor for ferrienterochelin and colicins